MTRHIARFEAQESQSAHYAADTGIPREAYEIMAAEKLYLMMAPETQGGPMAQKPGVAGEPGTSVIIARCPPGDKPLLHAHHFTVESFMCLTGRFRIRWGSAGLVSGRVRAETVARGPDPRISSRTVMRCPGQARA